MREFYIFLLSILLLLLLSQSFFNYFLPPKLLKITQDKHQSLADKLPTFEIPKINPLKISGNNHIGRSLFFRPTREKKHKKPSGNVDYELQLVGIIISERAPIAVIRLSRDNSLFRANVGSKISGWEIIKIENKIIIISKDSQKITVKLGEKV